jgi:arylsulfatase A-like enzyme
VQDLLARLDVTIAKLLAHLDATVGRDGYVLGFSADHGVSEIPEQTQDGGRITNAQIKDVLQKVLVEALGPGEHVAATQYTDHYLSPQAAERVQKDEQLRQALLDALRGVPGVQAAFHGPDLASAEARRSNDPVIRAAALSHHRGRSGDLIVVPRRRWITSTSAATHGTLHEYDQRVPVVLFGAGVKAGLYEQSATPADLAPSLAALVGIAMGDVDGRVLTEAVVVPHK